jgi:hypothetical protein
MESEANRGLEKGLGFGQEMNFVRIFYFVLSKLYAINYLPTLI